jgi:hypothetical protein
MAAEARRTHLVPNNRRVLRWYILAAAGQIVVGNHRAQRELERVAVGIRGRVDDLALFGREAEACARAGADRAGRAEVWWRLSCYRLQQQRGREHSQHRARAENATACKEALPFLANASEERPRRATASDLI